MRIFHSVEIKRRNAVKSKFPNTQNPAGEYGGAVDNARIRAITTMGAAQCPEAGGSLLIAADCLGLRIAFESAVVGAEYL